MDEYVIKQKIQRAFLEPRAPEGLIQQVILRANAVVMGVQAQKKLESSPTENLGYFASRALIGQLALVSELPQGSQPEALDRQVTGQSLSAEQAATKPDEPKMEGPAL